MEALGLATTVAGVCIALAARLTPANEADSDLAPRLLEELPEEARFVLGDTHYIRCPPQPRLLNPYGVESLGDRPLLRISDGGLIVAEEDEGR